ncbi:glutamate--tRNA ligase family protein [Planctomicrobium sp. SH661]|uniref:glutamate--tRNA ligase family protein n=1 Tax=Planctomicrobium sp. SH661 TaxID=3448124 RepID=UPI003F5B9792
MSVNTRFNPTANGFLHLGHLYLILVNLEAARSTGGRFIVRFDDDQPYWRDRLGEERIRFYCQGIREDLEWMGVCPDLFSHESLDREQNEAFLRSHGLEQIPPVAEDCRFVTPQILNCDRPYPYVPYLTAVKVAQDAREGCDLLIRGDDLVTEFSLYCWYCDRLRLPIPQFQYVPKLLAQNADLADVSKTSGNYKIRDFRDRGSSPQDVEQMLAVACLKEPEAGWHVDNLKHRPSLDAAMAEQTLL